MTDDNKEQAFLKAAKKTLDESLDTIDAATLTRLRAARRAAMTQSGPPPWRLWRNAWAPAGALTAVALVAVTAVSLWNAGMQDPVVPLAWEEAPILGSADDLEFYQELEFYYWLQDEQKLG